MEWSASILRATSSIVQGPSYSPISMAGVASAALAVALAWDEA